MEGLEKSLKKRIDDSNNRINDLRDSTTEGFRDVKSQLGEIRIELSPINSRIDNLAIEKANHKAYEKMEQRYNELNEKYTIVIDRVARLESKAS